MDKAKLRLQTLPQLWVALFDRLVAPINGYIFVIQLWSMRSTLVTLQSNLSAILG